MTDRAKSSWNNWTETDVRAELAPWADMEKKQNHEPDCSIHEYGRCGCGYLARLEKERDQARNEAATLLAAVEAAPCLAASPGETAYECRIDSKCRVCEWRQEVLVDLYAQRRADSRRQLTANFDSPSENAITVGDLIGLRRV